MKEHLGDGQDKDMNNRELSEVILVELYKLAEREGHGKPQSLSRIASRFGEKDLHKLLNILKLLEGRGLARDCNIAGDAMGYITAEGAMLVEEGGETGIIPRYKASPGNFIIDQSTKIYGDVHGSQITAHSTVNQQELRMSSESAALINQIVEKIVSDTTLGERHDEILADAKLVQRELSREQPRWQIVGSLLSTLSDVSSVSSLVVQLGSALGIGG